MFTKQYYEVVAEVIKDWRRLNPDMGERYFQRLIYEFVIAFKADNNKFDRYKFENAIKENHVKGQTKKA